ncbi:MAG: hypothetical protein ACRCWT_22025, partial [Aeromonas veronii]
LNCMKMTIVMIYGALCAFSTLKKQFLVTVSQTDNYLSLFDKVYLVKCWKLQLQFFVASDSHFSGFLVPNHFIISIHITIYLSYIQVI